MRREVECERGATDQSFVSAISRHDTRVSNAWNAQTSPCLRGDVTLATQRVASASPSNRLTGQAPSVVLPITV